MTGYQLAVCLGPCGSIGVGVALSDELCAWVPVGVFVSLSAWVSACMCDLCQSVYEC